MPTVETTRDTPHTEEIARSDTERLSSADTFTPPPNTRIAGRAQT